MKIDHHISALLLQYDCVIVPDFGGFVANYAPSKIHPVQHTFTAPSKKISFNKNLKNNDGLLAKHISNVEQIEYTEANKVIDTYVSICNNQLSSKKKFVINEVGTLSINPEGNISFEPDTSVNYLTDSFGLADFTSLAIKRENIEKKIERKIKDRKPIPQEKKKTNRKRYAALALTLPLLFALVWIPLKTEWLKNINYSNLNPFAEKIKSEYVLRKETKLALNESDFKEHALISENDTSNYIRLSLIIGSELGIVVRLKEEVNIAKTKIDNTSVANSNHKKSLAGLRFHIVGGCFQVLENAHRFIAQLKAKNITASIIGQNPSGLNIVSCGDYATREEALNELARIRGTNTEVWLLNK